MKNWIFTLILLASQALVAGQIRTVTKVLTFPPSGGGFTNFFSISSNEVASVVYFKLPGGNLYFTKDDLTHGLSQGGIIAGPASFTAVNPVGTWWTTVPITFEITPQVEKFPPERTVIIPEASTGALVTMECSTNLMHWTTVTNGFYTGTNGARFFRIRADRIP